MNATASKPTVWATEQPEGHYVVEIERSTEHPYPAVLGHLLALRAEGYPVIFQDTKGNRLDD